jgi:hypothetical protein
MSQNYDSEDAAEMDKWIRAYYNIKDGDETEAYLMGAGILEDTPDGLLARLRMAYAWIEPQATPQTRPIIDQIKAVVEEFKGRGSGVHIVYVDQSQEPKWKPDQPIIMPQRSAPVAILPPLMEADRPQLEKGQLLFEQAKALHQLQPVLQAQDKYRQAQRDRATNSGKLDEVQRKRIAERYWQSYKDGSTYGVPKLLAREYGVTPATIRACANKYKPDSIDK